MRRLSIDPGETVGWALWEGTRKVAGGQIPWADFLVLLAQGLEVGRLGFTVPAYGPFAGVRHIVMEDFIIYPEGVGDGPPPPWDEVITARLIGGIQVLADLAGVEATYQGADNKASGKAAAGDDLLVRPLQENRHENDATWHGAYYLARHPEKA